MRLELTDEQKMIQEMAADFAKSELAPVAATLDETKDRSILTANLKKMAELGLMTMNIPETYGGADVGVVAYSLAMTEIARACAATAVTMSVTNMVAEVILEFGTDEQKQKYIPLLASGEYPGGAFGLTETQAGSDPGNMRTMAVRDGNEFVINGVQDFYHLSRIRRRVRYLDRHRSGRRAGQGNLGFSGGTRHPGVYHRQGRKQDGPAGLIHQRTSVRRLPDS